jgi:hypothetical protein
MARYSKTIAILAAVILAIALAVFLWPQSDAERCGDRVEAAAVEAEAFAKMLYTSTSGTVGEYDRADSAYDAATAEIRRIDRCLARLSK